MAKCARCHEELRNFEWALRPYRGTVIQLCIECLRLHLTMPMDALMGETTQPDDQNTHLLERAKAFLNADSLFLKIGHGDADHQEWLRRELREWFAAKWSAVYETRQGVSDDK